MKYDLCIFEGEDFSLSFPTLVDEGTQDYIDLTVYTAEMDLEYGCKIHYSVPTISMSVNGVATIEIPGSVDFEYPYYYYKLILEDTSGNLWIPYYGVIYIRT